MKKKHLLLPSLSALALSATLFAGGVQAEEVVPAETITPDTSVTQPAPTVQEPVGDLTILHTNDVHGRIEEARGVIGVAKEATIVQEERAKDQTTVLVSAGDAFQGLAITNSSKGEDVANIMNEIGYDALALGNHEFDFGMDQLKKLDKMTNFPLLSANTYVDGVRLFDASTIVDKNKAIEGDEVVVIGVTTPETATKTHPNNVVGVTFTDPIKEVENVIAELEAKAKAAGKTYHNYIVLGHLGIDTTTPLEWRGSTMAEALSKNPLLANKRVVMIDGHSHSLASATYGHVLYNQTGNYLNNIGKVTYKGQEALAGVITAAETKDVAQDERIAALVSKARTRLDAENAVVVVENNPVELVGTRENVRVRETNLGNVVADALWSYGQTGFSNKTNLAVTNGGGLRETIKKDAPITRGDIVAVLPFGNTISQIQVTGQQIYDMFTKSLGSIHQVDADGKTVLDENGLPLLEPNGGFLHVSGARVYYDTNLPAEERILAIDVYDHETDSYLDLEKDKIYYLATNDFLAAGGDGYDMLGGVREEGPSMDTVFGEYLAEVGADLKEYAVVNPNERLKSVDSTVDTDGDGSPDYVEDFYGTDPENPDEYPVEEDETEEIKEEEAVTPNKPAVTEETNQAKDTEKDAKDFVEKTTDKTKKSANTYTKTSSHGTAIPFVRQNLAYATTKQANTVQNVPVAVSYLTATSAEKLPTTNAKESALALVFGLSLTAYGLYGMRKKSN